MQINRRTCNAVSKVKTLVSWRQTEGTRHTIHFLSVTHWHLRMLWQLLSFMRTECTRCKSVICDVVVFLFFSFILAREWTQVQMCISVLRIRLLFFSLFFSFIAVHIWMCLLFTFACTFERTACEWLLLLAMLSSYLCVCEQSKMRAIMWIENNGN